MRAKISRINHNSEKWMKLSEIGVYYYLCSPGVYRTDGFVWIPHTGGKHGVIRVRTHVVVKRPTPS